jgi:hypothetical protein
MAPFPSLLSVAFWRDQHPTRASVDSQQLALLGGVRRSASPLLRWSGREGKIVENRGIADCAALSACTSAPSARRPRQALHRHELGRFPSAPNCLWLSAQRPVVRLFETATSPAVMLSLRFDDGRWTSYPESTVDEPASLCVGRRDVRPSVVRVGYGGNEHECSCAFWGVDGVPQASCTVPVVTVAGRSSIGQQCVKAQCAATIMSSTDQRDGNYTRNVVGCPVGVGFPSTSPRGRERRGPFIDRDRRSASRWTPGTDSPWSRKWSATDPSQRMERHASSAAGHGGLHRFGELADGPARDATAGVI